MPPKKGDAHWTHLEDLSTEYRIRFLGEVEPSQWPDYHRKTLENAKQLGGKTYDGYATAPGVEESEPWKVKVKNLADLLVDTAGRCRQRNESSWRHACEPIIMGRLSSEVCCDYGDLTLKLPEKTGDRLLFPFLVLEAKSASSGYSWHRIQLQTAFSILTFLETQNLLRTATGRHSKWKSGPLVWFLANRGEDWRLYAAYMEPARVTTHTIGAFEYRVISIWNGSITTRNGALQLLLLVDYIFDWARDIYREGIIRELRALATGNNDAGSILHTDTDIFSTFPVDAFDQSGESSGEGDNFRACISAQESFSASDTPLVVVRHASLINSEYCCVFITRDNVKTMLQSMQQTKLKRFCGKILGHMNTASLVSLSALNAIEQQWTGCSRLSSHQLAETKFYTVVSVTTYISSTWHLICELFVVAIAQDAWTDFVVASKLKPNRGKTREPLKFKEVDEETLVNTIEQLQAGTPLQILHAAIVRGSVKIQTDGHDLLVLRDDGGDFRRIVHFVYVSFKKGTLEPQKPFIRFSRRLDQQHLFDCDVEPYFTETPHVSKDGCVLLTASLHPVEPDRSESSICAYLTANAPSLPPRQELSAIVANAFATCDVYHTTRSHWVSILAPLKQPHRSESHPWNLRNTYGVYSSGFAFLDLIDALGSEIPITQGSSRNSDECGSLLYERNFTPWVDPRFLYMNRKDRMFMLYKLFSREFQFWRATARDRRAQGLSCCECCAKIGEDDICYNCESVLKDPCRYQWFKDCLLGMQPFEITPLEGSKLKERIERSQNHDLSLREYIWNRRFEGPTDDNDDWAWNLDFYAKLEEPFRDISGLRVQLREYHNYSDRFPSRKRRHKELYSDQSSGELDTNSPKQDLDDNDSGEVSNKKFREELDDDDTEDSGDK